MTKLLSASRLNGFLGCQHQATLWLDGVEQDLEADPTLELVRTKGFEHEAVVLGSLEREHGPAVHIPTEGPLEERVEATRAAMQSAAPLIYQGAFANDRWLGFPDFLIGRHVAGRLTYEPEDAKLSGSAKADHRVQLNIYGDLVGEAGESPAFGAIHSPDGAIHRFDLRQTQHITRRYVRDFEQFVSTRPVTKATRSAACGRCGYKKRCEAEWRAADSPVFVAGVRADQLIKLEQAGITTLGQLAQLAPDETISGIGDGASAKLIRQAKLQEQGRREGRGLVELLPVEPQRGFCLLPPPQPGDLFFDIEGDPLFPEGLEYLLGLWGPLEREDANGFLGIWAHDHVQEKLAFEQLIDLFIEHLRRYPKAHIYHYAAYEKTALGKLASKYATREAELDQLLREQRFVDLFKVVKQGIRASTEGYSLKDLEKIYWGGRAGEVANAGDSIVEYERWRETGDDAILERIRLYNEEDVISTERMRDWLESLRPVGAVFGLAEVQEAPDASAEERARLREAFERERRQLADRVRAGTFADGRVHNLLAELLWFHQRAHKPVWWGIFDRQTWTDDDLMDDIESLGALTLVSQETDKRSFVATYAFQPQDTRLRVGSSPKIAATLENAGAIVELSTDDGRVVLRRGTKAGDFPTTCSLSPGAPIDQKVLVNGIMKTLQSLCEGGEDAACQALLDLLGRRAPRLAGRGQGEPVCDSEDLVTATVAAVKSLERSTLIIQGPPGTGKTYTVARAIVALLRDGKRVGVSSNSHKAIHNVLAAVEKHAAETGFRFMGVKKGSRNDDETVFAGPNFDTVFSSDDVKPIHALVGGTAYHFAAEDPRSYDYLFIDEAGQVALANVVAMAGCADNLVLVGDQMQLPQPVQGVHPGETGLSCLDYALQDYATVPADRGILLNVSRRMHPTICQFISEAIYDGRLNAHALNGTRSLVVEGGSSAPLKPFGMSVLELDHAGCTQSSPEEAEAVAALVQELLRQRVDEAGTYRPMTLNDILVVSPFNMQVALLKRVLPHGARVGTVDKFQGQEAPVVIVSMATSIGDDAPRGTEFLFNRNRTNVAISRAQCLAVIVRSRRLLDVQSAGLDDLPRLDVFARFDVAAAASNQHPSA